jgi:hypothetical protein
MWLCPQGGARDRQARLWPAVRSARTIAARAQHAMEAAGGGRDGTQQAFSVAARCGLIGPAAAWRAASPVCPAPGGSRSSALRRGCRRSSVHRHVRLPKVNLLEHRRAPKRAIKHSARRERRRGFRDAHARPDATAPSDPTSRAAPHPSRTHGARRPAPVVHPNSAPLPGPGHPSIKCRPPSPDGRWPRPRRRQSRQWRRPHSHAAQAPAAELPLRCARPHLRAPPRAAGARGALRRRSRWAARRWGGARGRPGRARPALASAAGRVS